MMRSVHHCLVTTRCSTPEINIEIAAGVLQ